MEMKSTTILAVRHQGMVAIGGDGQATLGHTVVKGTVNKIRRLGDGNILAGFAGSTADAFTLLDRFEVQLSASSNNMYRAAVALAKEWRTDRYLRKLEAMVIVADREQILTLSGTGDVLRADEGIASIGSGSMYAYSAALALQKHASHLSALELVKEGLNIAADICIYTNHNFVTEILPVE